MSDWRFAADMKTAHGLVGGASEGVVGKNSHLGNPPFRCGDGGGSLGAPGAVVKFAARAANKALTPYAGTTSVTL